MVYNTNNSLEEKLKEFIGKSVTITQDGFLKNKYSIHKLKYFIEYEILNIIYWIKMILRKYMIILNLY